MTIVFLGKRTVEVAAIGQGTMGIRDLFSRAQDSDAELIRLPKLLLDLCITVIDTKEVCGDDHAEELIGKLVVSKEHKAYIVTKFSAQNSTAAAPM